MKLPNILTFSRILLAPFFILFFLEGMKNGSHWALVAALLVAILFEVTDILDGFLARRYGQVSDLGKFLDPMADSMSRFTVFLCFLLVGYASIWAVAIIFWRDSVVSTLRIMGATRNVIISARWSGKVKAICQGIAIISILSFTVGPGLVDGRVEEVSRAVMWVIAAITVLSLFDYLHGNWKIIRSLEL